MLFFTLPAQAAPGVNKTISFQGRLLTSAGVPVPNGFYNIQFKIYQDGTGTEVGNPDGELKWTETYINNSGQNGVKVTNGYMSVNLGSINAFGNSIDWNQDTLWLSMNIAGLTTGCTTFNTGLCTADGEMTPMKRLTATPYAMNAGMLGGLTADRFLQLNDDQSGSFGITGTARANTLQGNTSIITPMLDTDNYNTALTIGSVTTGTVNIATMANDQEINIGTGVGNKTISIGAGTGQKIINIGSIYNDSEILLQGGSNGVAVKSSGGFGVYDQVGTRQLLISGGNATFTIGAAGSSFAVQNSNGDRYLSISENAIINTRYGTHLSIGGTVEATRGITIQGGGLLSYRTPGGYDMKTAINIPNYTLGEFESVIALGLPSTSAATARGLLVADGRTGAHQATIGILSPDESAIFGMSYNGSNTVGTISNTANSVALQGNGLNLLTATNNGGVANVGIGNAASSGHALDVTGDTNVSGQYRINGVATLSNSALSFSGASSTVSATTGQSLNLASDTKVQIGDSVASGGPTLLSLDKASSAPAGSSAILGSMYYDTTLGVVQCYEEAGWGACGASPDVFVNLAPEYANSVQNGTGTGTMKSDFCSATLNINNGTSGQPNVCGTNETYNYYDWTSPSTGSSQAKSHFITYQLPSNFKEFVNDSVSLTAKTDSTNATVTWLPYRKTATGLVACGTTITGSTGVQTTWQKTSPSNTNISNCGFTAGDSIVFVVSMNSSSDAHAYVSDLNFAYKTN